MVALLCVYNGGGRGHDRHVCTCVYWACMGIRLHNTRDCTAVANTGTEINAHSSVTHEVGTRNGNTMWEHAINKGTANAFERSKVGISNHITSM
ncbi:hypothetical protein POVWA2_058070 [Plasmodium ovale wallikeri]|uniref:Uncharacterized protein n=1 Tax=Plasmodium ovale wallikeri TaxID=864142 RepID=A0A1A8ZYU7_PLAOA|nr:hypothetical protein POVWA1_058770 [Plasmodium ovale wallikeri]SBT49407.1 hypothetical protein POVWA2_058070 [Plasmodium ovale wallikeri]